MTVLVFVSLIISTAALMFNVGFYMGKYVGRQTALDEMKKKEE